MPLLVSTVTADIIKANPAFYRLLNYPVDGSVRAQLREGQAL